jgi:hypothetical protein
LRPLKYYGHGHIKSHDGLLPLNIIKYLSIP